MDMTTYLIDGPNLIVASVLVLALGHVMKDRVAILSRLNLPIAVIGGIICSIFLTILYKGFNVKVDFDMALRDLLLLTFFSTIGLSAKLNALASGGKTLIILLFFAVFLLVFQDTVGIGIALLNDAHPAYGLFAGSISFAGGHGTAIAWGQVADDVGLDGAATLGIACATFGLVAGGLIGSPVGGYLVKKYGLATPEKSEHNYETVEPDGDENNLPIEGIFTTLFLLAVCIGVGHNINNWLSSTGISLPQFLTAMFVGIVLTNLSDALKLKFHVPAVNRAGEISLHLFLAMSLMSMQLWKLADALGILLVILIVQMVVISVIGLFFVFRFTGKDYDASVIAAGFLGLGLGATPVAMANMQAMTSRYGPSSKAFIVVPLVGAFFMDLSNAVVIKVFTMLPLMQQGF